jgi:Fur family zinc uptake transcriptional regulator
MSFVDKSMQVLHEAGYKYTKKRADMLNVFDQEGDYFLNAKEIQQRLETQYPGISFDTIYRNLKLFEEYHFLETSEISGEMVFRKHCNPNMGHHHHFICMNCGKTQAIQSCPVSFFQDQLPGCQIINHTIELQGLCADCQVL